MTNKILTHLALALGHKLPGRLESPALARLATAVQGLNQEQRQESERSIAYRFGHLSSENATRSFSDNVQVEKKQMWRVLEDKSRFALHLNDMSFKLNQNSQRAKLHIPPLDFLKRSEQVQNNNYFSQRQSQMPKQQISREEQIGWPPNPYFNYYSPFEYPQSFGSMVYPSLPCTNPLWDQNNPFYLPMNPMNPFHGVFHNVPNILNPGLMHINAQQHQNIAPQGHDLPNVLKFDPPTLRGQSGRGKRRRTRWDQSPGRHKRGKYEM